MKTYEEMADSALGRIEKLEKEKKKRRKTAARIVLPALCVCMAAGLGFGAWQAGLFTTPSDIVVEPGETEESGATEVFVTGDNAATEAVTAANEDVTQAYAAQTQETPQTQAVTQAPETPQTQAVSEATAESGTSVEPTQSTQGQKGSEGVVVDSALINWKNNMCISASLYQAMSDAPDGAYTVTASYCPATAEITDFVYEGKTLSERAIASENARFTLHKMHELLKQGEELKLGAALYETGLPDGTKWDRRLYEDKVAYYGELIDKYIVNGEFLHEQLSKDIAEYGMDTYVEKYKLAYNAYLETVLPSVMQKLTQSGISCSRAAYSVNGITFTVTQTQLENIPLDDITNWFFDLAENGQKGVVAPA